MNIQPAPKTPRATPTAVRSSKRNWIAALATAFVLASAIPARAIVFRLEEDSLTRFAFDLKWEASPFQPIFRMLWTDGDLFAGYVYDTGDEVVVSRARSTGGPVPYDVSFTIFFARGIHDDRSFEVSDLVGFSGTEVLPLNKGEIGARFVYGTPLGIVPDHGATGLLLGAGLFGLVLARRGALRLPWALVAPPR